MKTGWKITLAVAVFLVVFTGIWLTTMRLQPESKLEAYKKSLRERGEKLEINEVLPPAVPAASNSVDAVEDAFRMFGSGSEPIPDAMKMVMPGKAMVGWMQPEAHGYDFTNSWDDFSAKVAADRPAIELLHQVLERPTLDFQLDYKMGATLPLPHLALMKHAVQKLGATTICNLHDGDTDTATTNILTMVGLVQKNAGEGLLISHLVRIAMTAITVAPTWELLQATNITDAQLTAVQQGWEALDFLSDATNAMVVERAWVLDYFQKARASHEQFEKMVGGSIFFAGSPSTSSSGGWDWEAMTEKSRHLIGEVMWRSSWSYSDELRTLQNETIILDTLRMMQTNQSQFYKADYDAMRSKLSSLGITNAGHAFFNALKIPDFGEIFGDLSLSSIVLKTIRIETTCRMVVTAVALRRFQLKHGKLPETLQELMPDLLSSVPIDPYDGKPLKYHPNPDGTYLLYSVGEDGVDDGGDPTNTSSSSPSMYWQGNKVRDWVWPQPATAEEIQLYNDEQAKKGTH